MKLCGQCAAPLRAATDEFPSLHSYTGRHLAENILTSKSTLERAMEAVHHHEGAVNQVMGHGIMALFGAPPAKEDHAVRACPAALRMPESMDCGVTA